MPPSAPPPKFRRLSESEIHDQLYGEYHRDGRRRQRTQEPDPDTYQAPIPLLPPPIPSTSTAASEPVWTGQEILAKELERLSTELSTLRQEKDALAIELRRRAELPLLPPARPRFAAAPRSWVTVGSWLIMSAALAAVCHTMVLEAQPPLLGGLPGTVYTVQAGVYDVRVVAQRFVDTLSRDGYPAFLVEGTTALGKKRYRVYVGRYTSKVAAQVHLDLLKRSGRAPDGFVLQRRP